MFQDETGFTRHPRLGLGWAKRGCRLKIATTSEHHKRLNVFGWVAPLLGRLGLVRAAQGNREGFLECLRNLYQRLRGFTIWLYVDGASWHKGEEIDLFLESHVRLHLTYLPRYQPGLNAEERVWRELRYEATTNRWFESLDATWDRIRSTCRSWTQAKVQRLCNIT